MRTQTIRTWFAVAWENDINCLIVLHHLISRSLLRRNVTSIAWLSEPFQVPSQIIKKKRKFMRKQRHSRNRMAKRKEVIKLNHVWANEMNNNRGIKCVWMFTLSAVFPFLNYDWLTILLINLWITCVHIYIANFLFFLIIKFHFFHLFFFISRKYFFNCLDTFFIINDDMG